MLARRTYAPPKGAVGLPGAVAFWLLAVLVITDAAPDVSLAGPTEAGELPRLYAALHVSPGPEIDGVLDDQAWGNAAWTEDFLDIQGKAFPRPRLTTRAKIVWDDEHLYVGAEMEEPDLWATLTSRDAVVWHDDDFEIFIDPNGDNHEYVEIEVNAYNTVFDLFLTRPYRDRGAALHDWDIGGLISAVSVHGSLNHPGDRDRGWSLEVGIPWRALAPIARRPTPPSSGDRWRMNFSRVDWDLEVTNGGYREIAGRAEHNWTWTPQGSIDMHRPEHWGIVEFRVGPDGPVLPDPAQPARDLLMRLYYAQRSYRDRHGHWAENPEELGVDIPDAAWIARGPWIETAGEAYRISIEIHDNGGPNRTWRVSDTSRLFRSPASGGSR